MAVTLSNSDQLLEANLKLAGRILSAINASQMFMIVTSASQIAHIHTIIHFSSEIDGISAPCAVNYNKYNICIAIVYTQTFIL